MFYRHNRIWLTSSGWQRACAAADAQHVPALERWAENDWPLIVRRSEAALAASHLGLGLALPPDADTGKKTRIALAVHQNDIARQELPLTCAAAAQALPADWQAVYASLSYELIEAQLEFRVYGSLALQAITGLPYLTATSDIDILFYPCTHAQLQQGLYLLGKYAQVLPLDGEIVFPSGHAVAWKEWRAAAESQEQVKVMVKSMTTLNLMDVTTLLSGLEELS